MPTRRQTGIDLVPTARWGIHFCQFYRTREDLLGQVVPFLRAGLEQNEACVWVTSDRIDVASARAALSAVVPGLDRLEACGQVHIVPYDEWYLEDGVFDRHRVLDRWLTHLGAALDRGFAGLRITADTAWLEKNRWTDFAAYEAAVSSGFAGRPVLVLCTYALDRCGAQEILDVVKNHDFALVKRADRWEVVESHDRQSLTAALETTRQHYQALFTQALSAIAVHQIVTDADGQPIDYVFLDANPAFELMTGLKRTQVVGRRVTEVLPGIEQSRFISTFGRVALTGEPQRFEAFAEPLGRHYDISALSLGGGQFATIFRDISDDKKATAERERLLSEAQDANRLKDEFLATLSHELRTPLNAILGWSQLLLSGSLDEPMRRRAAEAIVRNAEAQNRLVDDVLDVSRIITGKLRLAMVDVDLTGLVDDALAALRLAADAKQIRFEKVVTAPSAWIVGDPDRLRQVFWNLLANAVKFTQPGGDVRVEIGREGARIEVRVADSGVGIAPEFLPRVFDRFTMADGSTSRLHGGLGLGLAIVRHLVELHGGEVSAESSGEGRGATFSVRLPVRAVRAADEGDERPASEETVPDSSAADLAGLRVLVVDDQADARDVVRLVLTEAGAEVVVADSAEAALRTLEDGGPVDVIISDIGMPDIDGYGMIGALRALGGLAEMTPAIALTAYGRPEDRARALACGYQDHVAKPVRPADLISALRKVRASGQFRR
jgi:signal transduction histidine kinase/ActR/RegA family two-component response regulator